MKNTLIKYTVPRNIPIDVYIFLHFTLFNIIAHGEKVSIGVLAYSRNVNDCYKNYKNAIKSFGIWNE